MTKPDLRTFVFGSAIIRTFLSLTSFGSAYTYIDGSLPMANGTGIMLMLVFVMTGYSWQCAKVVAHYRERKAQWDAMDGPAGPGFLSRCFHSKGLRWFLGLSVWTFFALGTYGIAEDGQYGPFVTFAILTLLFLVIKWRRRAKRRGPSPAHRIQPVTISVSASHSSPNAAQYASALPDHCKSILNQSN